MVVFLFLFFPGMNLLVIDFLLLFSVDFNKIVGIGAGSAQSPLVSSGLNATLRFLEFVFKPWCNLWNLYHFTVAAIDASSTQSSLMTSGPYATLCFLGLMLSLAVTCRTYATLRFLGVMLVAHNRQSCLAELIPFYVYWVLMLVTHNRLSCLVDLVSLVQITILER